MLRAPICTTSATASIASAWPPSSSSVTIGSPVSSRASARISSAGTPSPLKANGEVRGLNAPPRSIAAPLDLDGVRDGQRLLARLDRARSRDQGEGLAAADLAAGDVEDRFAS